MQPGYRTDENRPPVKALAAVTVLLVILILLMVLFLLRAETVSVKGNRAYSEKEIEDMVFPDEKDRSLLLILYREKTGKKKNLPFIISYNIGITGPESCEIIVYEKKPVGFVSYMGSNMYFDKDGNVIESSQEQMDGVPEVTGLQFGEIILDKKLKVAGSEVFEKILNISSQLESYRISLKQMDFDDTGNVTLYLGNGDIRVKIGNDEFFATRLSLINDVYAVMKERGLKGTADLSGYSDIKSDGFTFIPD